MVDKKIPFGKQVQRPSVVGESSEQERQETLLRQLGNQPAATEVRRQRFSKTAQTCYTSPSYQL